MNDKATSKSSRLNDVKSNFKGCTKTSCVVPWWIQGGGSFPNCRLIPRYKASHSRYNEYFGTLVMLSRKTLFPLNILTKGNTVVMSVSRH